jgi:hypothetical protein
MCKTTRKLLALFFAGLFLQFFSCDISNASVAQTKQLATQTKSIIVFLLTAPEKVYEQSEETPTQFTGFAGADLAFYGIASLFELVLGVTVFLLLQKHFVALPAKLWLLHRALLI